MAADKMGNSHDEPIGILPLAFLWRPSGFQTAIFCGFSQPAFFVRSLSRVMRLSRKTKGRTTVLGGIDPAYLALIRRFPLRPIRTDAELDAASGVVDELTDRDKLSAAESDYLDVLGDLIERYEDEHIEMPKVSDATMLRSIMEEKGATQADVARGTGISKTVLSLVLNGKRDLTREHIRALSMYFGVNASSFLGPI
ncbi:MAG: helix-turn-helix domain-containing protein [Isosphaeraceae bacterium]